jgi:hypothetical protein
VAILEGYNKYYFSTPVVKGHTYGRTISIDKKARLIYYLLEDTSSKAQESFKIDIPIDFILSIVSVYRGVEWHNRVSDRA